MEENGLQKALGNLAASIIGEDVGEIEKAVREVVGNTIPCVMCYKFLKCCDCENWLHCDERIEKAKRAQCFECDGIGRQKTCRK